MTLRVASTASDGSAGRSILADCDPARLPWKQLEVEVVVESTGSFREPSLRVANLVAYVAENGRRG